MAGPDTEPEIDWTLTTWEGNRREQQRRLREDIDYGTPPRDGEPVTLTVDGVEVTVPEGSSVMLAAAEARRAIPKLCATDMIESFGSCRVCLVETERAVYFSTCRWSASCS